MPTQLTTSTAIQTQSQLNAPQKLRGFVVDKDSGYPLPGILIQAVAQLDDVFKLPLGMLVSDAAGYVSFDLKTLRDLGVSTLKHLWITPVRDDTAKQDVLAMYRVKVDDPCDMPKSSDPPSQSPVVGTEAQKASNNLPVFSSIQFWIKVDGRLAELEDSRIRLPSIQHPDLGDWELSPYSFTTKSDILLGEGGCAVPVPATVAEREHRITQVVRTAPPGSSSSPTLESARATTNLSYGFAKASSSDKPTVFASEGSGISIFTGTPLLSVNLLDPDYSARLNELKNDMPIGYGKVLEFRQSWIPMGHSLGSILYSAALAPCESVNLAVIDWSRKDHIQREDSIVSREGLYHSQRRDRIIDEAVEAAVHESQGGWSLMGGVSGAESVGASATVPIEGIPVNLSLARSIVGSLGGGIANSWGNRDLTGESIQELHDSVVQKTNVLRSLHSTVIVQATQEEHNYLETRTITNHNHCHALTIQYYEVLRHFKVVTEFVRSQPAVLIPYKVYELTPDIILRRKTILEAALLDRELLPCFDAIIRFHYCPEIYELIKSQESDGCATGKNTDKTQTVADFPVSKIRFRIKRGTWGTESKPSEKKTSVRLKLKTKDGTDVQFKSDGADTERLEVYDEGIEGDKSQTHEEWLSWHEADLSSSVMRSQLSRVQVEWKPHWSATRPKWSLRGLDVRTTSPQGEHIFFFDEQPGDLEADADSWERPKVWEKPVIPFSPSSESDQSQSDDKGASSLEPGKGAPSREMDKCCIQQLVTHLNSNIGYYNRAIWLLQDPTERVMMLNAALAPYPEILNYIGTTPIAVSGNYVAYPLNIPANDGQQDSAQYPPAASIVSVPTRGVFAETHLSHCNACEVRDVTRFWKWEESPCEKPPTIEGITPGPRGQPPKIEPTTLPSPVVQIMQPPAAPDPVGLAAALNLLGQPNIFRDMSGMKELQQLLSGLASGAVDLAKAQQLANKVNEKMATGTQGGGGPSRPQDASDLYDKFRVLEKEEQKGNLSPKQANEAREAYIQADVGTGGSGTAGSLPLELLNELVMGATRSIFGTEPTLSEAYAKGDDPWDLPTWRISLMSKDEFFSNMSNADRDTWYREQLGPFSKQLIESTNKHKVPVQLIATVIFAELIDINEYDLIQEEAFVTNGSLGIAQIQIDTAIGEKLFTDINLREQQHVWQEVIQRLSLISPPLAAYRQATKKTGDEMKIAVNRRLRVPQHAIDAAAGFIRLHLVAASGNRAKAWASKFGFTWTGASLSNPNDFYNFIAGADQKEKEANLAAMVAGRHNTPAITGASSIGPGEFSNALFQADSASKISKELFGLKLFRSTP